MPGKKGPLPYTSIYLKRFVALAVHKFSSVIAVRFCRAIMAMRKSWHMQKQHSVTLSTQCHSLSLNHNVQQMSLKQGHLTAIMSSSLALFLQHSNLAVSSHSSSFSFPLISLVSALCCTKKKIDEVENTTYA